MKQKNRLPLLSEQLLNKMEKRMAMYVKTGLTVPYALKQEYNALVEKVNEKIKAESLREHKAYLAKLSPEELLAVAKGFRE